MNSEKYEKVEKYLNQAIGNIVVVCDDGKWMEGYKDIANELDAMVNRIEAILIDIK